MSALALVAALSLAVDAGLSAVEKPMPNPEAPLNVPVPKSRFELQAPLTTAPPVMVDAWGNSFGVAQETARRMKMQARVLWIDATANLERVNSDTKVAELVRTIAIAGFNTVVFDVKPISGQVLYPSKLAPKITEWRGRTLPADYDPLAAMVRECRANNLTVMVSLNAFSEGHRDFRVGPGYGKPRWQTVLYEPKFSVISAMGQGFPLNPTQNRIAPDGTTIAAFNVAQGLPANDAFFAVVLDRSGVVVEALSGAALRTVNIPTNGSVLVGSGDAANYLRGQAMVGTRVRFDSTAEFVPISERPEQQIPLITNPNEQEVVDYNLALVREVVGNYDIDGFLYDDRLRYGNINADFSPQAQAAFERYVGRRLAWPDDIYKSTLTPGLARGMQVGPYYEAWMTWRAQVMRNFVQRVRDEVKKTRPRTLFGVYAGSTFADYPRFGHNWAAPNVDAGYWFLTPEYSQTGTANLMDVLMTGCYYPTPTIADAMANGVGIGFSVEGSAQAVNRLVNDQTWTVAGIMLSQFRNDPQRLLNALQAACAASQGVMVFDLSHDIEPFWPVFRQAFADRRQPPYAAPGLLKDVRAKRAELDRKGQRMPPIPIVNGGAGTGL